jgi:hypothetical protein
MLYSYTVYAKVYLGYHDGIAHPAVRTAPPIYGQIISDHVRGVQVLHLWPYDFPLSARAGSDVVPLASLWKPQLSGVLHDEFGLSGLECLHTGGKARWVAQRWLCSPTTFQSIQEAIRQRPASPEARGAGQPA